MGIEHKFWSTKLANANLVSAALLGKKLVLHYQVLGANLTSSNIVIATLVSSN